METTKQTTKTTTTTNKEGVNLDKVRMITEIPLMLKLELVVHTNKEEAKVLDTINIPFVRETGGKGFKAGENVVKDEKGEIIKVNQLEYNDKEGVIKFVPSDDGFNRLDKVKRSDWATLNSYLGIRNKQQNMLLQGISNNIRIAICTPLTTIDKDRKVIPIEMSGENLRNAILNHTPTKLKGTKIVSGSKDSPHKTSDVLESIE